MKTVNIFHIRDDERFDEAIKKAAENLSIPAKIEFKERGFFKDNRLEDLDIDIVVVNGNFDNKPSGQNPSEKSFAVIELLPEEEINRSFENHGRYTIERVPDFIPEKSNFFFSGIMEKTLHMLNERRNNNNLLSAIFSLLMDGASLFDLEGNILQSNARLLGYTPAELREKNIFELMDKESAKRARKFAKTAKNTEVINKFEANLVKANNEIIPVEINARLLRSYSGKPLYYLAIITDLTEKRKAWQSKQFLGRLINTTGETFVAVNKKNEVILWNKGAEKLFGFSADEMLGKKVPLLTLNPGHANEQETILEKTKEDGFTRRVIVDRRRKDGSIITVEITMSAIHDEKGKVMGVFGIIREVSGEQQNLDYLRRKKEEIEHLINVVSHDLRTPLCSVGNHISAIQNSISDKIKDEKILETFERIHANLYTVESLIEDLTDFSTAGVVIDEEVAVNLDSLIDDVINNIRWQTGEYSLDVKTEHLPTIRVSPLRIQQVFENLISNAYKFRKEDEECKIEINCDNWGKEIVFSIKDNGMGISPEHHEKIFNLFYRSKEKEVDGSGAGLAITRKIVETYGGKIWVESKPNEGSTFKFTLPASLVVKD